MGSGKKESTQTTTQTLPGNQQQVVDLMLNGAMQNYMEGGRQFFPGDLVADFNPNQTQGQEMLVNYAGGLGSDLATDAIQANQFWLDPSTLFNLDQIPGFSGAEDRLTRGYTDNLTRNILPQIRSGAIASGQFGGTPQGIGEGLAVGESNAALGDSLSNLYLGAYGSGLDMMSRAMGLAPSMFALGAAPGNLIQGVGDTQQQQAQNEIQADVARHEFEQNEPIFQLQLLRDLAGRFGDYGGTTRTKATEKTGSSPVNQALGGALSLASLWNPMTSVFSGLGTGAGAAGSGPGFNPFLMGV